MRPLLVRFQPASVSRAMRTVEAANGEILERVVYDAYGAVTTEDLAGAEKPGKDKFTGKEVDHEGGSPAGISVINLNIKVSAIPIELIHKFVYLTLADGTQYSFIMIRSIGDDSYNVNQQIEINGSTVLKSIVIEITYNPGVPPENNGFSTFYSVGTEAGCGFNITVPGGKTQEVNFNHPYTDNSIFTRTLNTVECDNSAGHYVLPAQTTNAVAGGMKLYYFGKRYYDAEIGDFATTDLDHQFFNPYAYGPGNPVNGLDEKGTYWIVEHIRYGRGELTGAVDRRVPVEMYYTVKTRDLLKAQVLGYAKETAIGKVLEKIPVFGEILSKIYEAISLMSSLNEQKEMSEHSEKYFDATNDKCVLPSSDTKFRTATDADNWMQNQAKKGDVKLENWGDKKVEERPAIIPGQ